MVGDQPPQPRRKAGTYRVRGDGGTWFVAELKYRVRARDGTEEAWFDAVTDRVVHPHEITEVADV